VAVVVGHRYPSLAAFPTSDGDLAAALAYLRDEAADLRIDPERLAVWVFSGGGLHLARFLRTPEPGVRCLVAYYPVLDPDAFGRLLAPARRRSLLLRFAHLAASRVQVLSDPLEPRTA